MAHPFHHACGSVKLFGGNPEDYTAIHNRFDESKAHLPDLRHRALRHHSEGIFLCERFFGITFRNSAGKDIPTRLVAEQHIKDDLGWIPTVKDWLINLKIEPWMTRTAYRPARDSGEPPFENPNHPALPLENGAESAGVPVKPA